MLREYVNLKVYREALTLLRLISKQKGKPMTEIIFGWVKQEAKNLGIEISKGYSND